MQIHRMIEREKDVEYIANYSGKIERDRDDKVNAKANKSTQLIER